MDTLTRVIGWSRRRRKPTRSPRLFMNQTPGGNEQSRCGNSEWNWSPAGGCREEEKQLHTGSTRLGTHTLKVELLLLSSPLSPSLSHSALNSQTAAARSRKVTSLSPTALVTALTEPSGVLHCVPFMFWLRGQFPQNHTGSSLWGNMN